MQLTFRFAHSLCAFSFLATVFSGYALDGIKKFYYSWGIVHPIFQKVEAGSKDGKCKKLLREDEQRKLVLNSYAPPRWVTWLSAIPFKESMLNYAYDTYQMLYQEMYTFMESLAQFNSYNLDADSRKVLDQQLANWRQLESSLYIIFNAFNASKERVASIEVQERDIINNINVALNIVKVLIDILPTISLQEARFITELKTPQSDIKAPRILPSQAKIQAASRNEVTKTKFLEQKGDLEILKNEIIAQAKIVRARLDTYIKKDICGKDRLTRERLSAVERWHRNKQAKWLSDYITNVCICPVGE